MSPEALRSKHDLRSIYTLNMQSSTHFRWGACKRYTEDFPWKSTRNVLWTKKLPWTFFCPGVSTWWPHLHFWVNQLAMVWVMISHQALRVLLQLTRFTQVQITMQWTFRKVLNPPQHTHTHTHTEALPTLSECRAQKTMTGFSAGPALWSIQVTPAQLEA